MGIELAGGSRQLTEIKIWNFGLRISNLKTGHLRFWYSNEAGEAG